MKRKLFAALLIASFVLPVAISEETQKKDKEADIALIDIGENQNVFVFSSKIPESPGMALAGLDASKVTRASEIRKFVLSLPSSFDRDTRQAIALDLSPSEILFENKKTIRTLDNYTDNKNRLYRIARRAKVSIAVQGGKEDNQDRDRSIQSLIAIGATTSLLDSSDPLYAMGRTPASAEFACKTALHPIIIESLLPDTYVHGVGNLLTDLQSASYIIDYLRSSQKDNAIIEADALKEIEEIIELAKIARNKLLEEFERRKRELGHLPGIVPAESPPPLSFTLGPEASYSDLSELENQLKKIIRYIDLPEFKAPNPHTKAVQKLMLNCQQAIAHAVEMGAGLDIGGAMIWRGNPGGLGDFGPSAQAVWLSARKGIWQGCQRQKDSNGVKSGECTPGIPNSYAVAGVSARIANDETVSTGDSALKEAKADTWQAWAGIEYFSENWRMAGRYGYHDVNFSDPRAQGFSKSGDLWQVDGDLRLNETLWIGLSYGRAAGTHESLDGEVFKLTVKFSTPTKLTIFAP